MFNLSGLMNPAGAGGGQMERMIQLMTMARGNPEQLAKIMATKGVPVPKVTPVEVKQLRDITPKKGQSQLKEIPLKQPTIDTTQLRGPPPAPANISPGSDIGGLLQAMSALQVPQQQMQRPDFAPAMPLNRTNAQIDPNIMQRLMGLMAGAQSAQAPSGISLGQLIAGR